MSPTVREVLSPLPERALRRSSAVLADLFSCDLLISTLHTGERIEACDAAMRDDLRALADALPEGCLSTDIEVRDAAAFEPPMLTAIRQAEGQSPELPAVLLPRSEAEAFAVLAEASAAGFASVPGGTRRPIGLSFARIEEITRDPSGRVRIGAGTRWAALCAFAEANGLGSGAAALANRYAAPIDAVADGVFGASEPNASHGALRDALLTLPPVEVGATDRAWRLPETAAEGALDAIVRLHAPLYAEILPPADVAVLRASGRIGRVPGGDAVIRVVSEATRGVRAATMREIGRLVRRAGGRICQRGPLPDDAFVAALAAVGGAARIECPALPDVLPPSAIAGTRRVAVRGRLRESRVIWYPRALGRSIDQAAELLGRPAAGVTVRGDDESWDALRAALTEALP